MGQPIGALGELSPEAVARIRWVRRRLISWFEQSGRSLAFQQLAQSIGEQRGAVPRTRTETP